MVVLNGEADADGGVTVTAGTIEQCTSKRALLYDKGGEEHYNLISALHKSMRNSDPDAAVYWLARMLEAGEDPLMGQLAVAVKKANKNENWRKEKMALLTFEEDMEIQRRIAEKKGQERGQIIGLQMGLEQGLAEGREQGLAEGLEQGLAEGREQGLAEGRAEAASEVASLLALL